MTLQPPTPADAVPHRTFLKARTRRQALDWSLVLLSQGIESEPTRLESSWGLWIEPEQATKAQDILTQYRAENRRWFWLRRPLPQRPIWHPLALGWAVLLLAFHEAQRHAPDLLESRGCVVSKLAIVEPWRLITAMTLHADVTHLFGNLTVGTLVFAMAMAAHGPGWALLLGLLGGTAGNGLSVLLHGAGFRSLGASGMVMAALGLLATAGSQASPGHPARPFWIARGLIGALLLFVLLGLDPGSDVPAHLGGMLAGAALGAAFARLPAAFRLSPGANLIAAVAALLLLALSWGLALSRVS